MSDKHPEAPTPFNQIAAEKVAKRAYEKWCRRGKPHGTADRDWYEAEAELQAEVTRNGTTPSKR